MSSGNNATVTQLVVFAEASFGVVDYVVFTAFLCLSGGIGIFFSYRGQKTTGEYFFGNRQMNAIPVGISTGVSFMSATSLVGFPAEMYNNGWSFMLTVVSGTFFTLLGLFIVTSIIHPLRVKSLNEYFDKRFKLKLVSKVTAFIMLACIFQYMGTCMFGSITAIKSATNGKIGIVTGLFIGGSVGVFYTAIGGLKAVIWADVFQCGFMILGVAIVAIKSMIDSPGGLVSKYETYIKYERFKTPSLSFDLTIRHSLWSVLIGGGVAWLVWCTQPALIQRLVSVKTRRDCCIVALMTCSIYAIFTLIPCLIGINIFDYYVSRGCDVFAAGWIEKNDIIMYYIRDRLSIPGFQGLFVAALFAGSLSSLSSGLNSASSIIWNDLIRPCFHQQPSELRATFISKFIVVLFGVVGVMWSYVLISFGGMIMQVVQSIDASMYGAYFSLFVYAILFRYANSPGAIAGMVCSFGFTLWLGLSSLLYGKSHIENLPTTTANCSSKIIANASFRIAATQNSQSNMTVSTEETRSFLDTLYSLSYLWFSLICIIIYLLVSLLVTACTKQDHDVVNPNLLLSVCRPGYFQARECHCISSKDELSDQEETGDDKKTEEEMLVTKF